MVLEYKPKSVGKIKPFRYIITYSWYGKQRTIFSQRPFRTKHEAEKVLRNLMTDRKYLPMYVNPRIRKIV